MKNNKLFYILITLLVVVVSIIIILEIKPKNENVSDESIVETSSELDSSDGAENVDKVVEDKVVEDKVVEDKVVEGKVVEGKVVEDKVVEDKVVEGKVVEGKVVEDKVVEDKVVEDKVVGEKVELKNTGPNSNEPTKNLTFLRVIIILSVITNIVIAFFIYQYHRKRILMLSDKRFVQPEDMQIAMQGFHDALNKCNEMLGRVHQENNDILRQVVQQTRDALSKLDESSNKHEADIGKLMDTFLSLNSKIEEKENEIKRYKEGYDVTQIKKSILGYIRVRDRIEEYINSGKTSQSDLEKLNIILESAFETAGAKEIDIAIGDDFYDEKYISKTDTPKILSTENAEEHNKIASVEKKGYEITGYEKNTIIRQAKVTIYKKTKNED